MYRLPLQIGIYGNPENCWVFWTSAERRSSSLQFQSSLNLKWMDSEFFRDFLSLHRSQSSWTLRLARSTFMSTDYHLMWFTMGDVYHWPFHESQPLPCLFESVSFLPWEPHFLPSALFFAIWLSSSDPISFLIHHRLISLFRSHSSPESGPDCYFSAFFGHQIGTRILVRNDFEAEISVDGGWVMRLVGWGT
jgi:hypothetical protein